MMRNLFLVCCGDCEGKNLSVDGLRQIRKVSNDLFVFFENRSNLIVYSGEDTALVESAGCIASRFDDVSVKTIPELTSSKEVPDFHQFCNSVVEILTKESSDVVIVAYQKVLKHLPNMLASKFFTGSRAVISSITLLPGQAYHIEFEGDIIENSGILFDRVEIG